MKKRLITGLSYTNLDPIVSLNIITENISKILHKLETEQSISDGIINKQANIIKKLSKRQSDIERDFAEIRLDLKSANILHDEEYTLPPVDDISNPPTRIKSKLSQLENNKPF